jgi:hypothetical protein
MASYDKARLDFKKALELDPGNREVFKVWLFLFGRLNTRRVILQVIRALHKCNARCNQDNARAKQTFGGAFLHKTKLEEGGGSGVGLQLYTDKHKEEAERKEREAQARKTAEQKKKEEAKLSRANANSLAAAARVCNSSSNSSVKRRQRQRDAKDKGGGGGGGGKSATGPLQRDWISISIMAVYFALMLYIGCRFGLKIKLFGGMF